MTERVEGVPHTRGIFGTYHNQDLIQNAFAETGEMPRAQVAAECVNPPPRQTHDKTYVIGPLGHLRTRDDYLWVLNKQPTTNLGRMANFNPDF
jgi:hypothetical protein